MSVEHNKFYRKTNQKKRSLATSQIVCKDGFRVELPATCFNKTTGLIKASVYKDYVGHWNKERVDHLIEKYGAILLKAKESA